MATVYEIIQGIHQAASLGANDGIRDKDEDYYDIGLMREEGDMILDSRVMDGFKVSTAGNTMKLMYQGDTTMKEVREDDFEDEVTSRINDIVSFIKKEYKKVVGESLSLKMIGEPQIDVEHQNRLRSWFTAQCVYEVGGMDLPTEDKDQKRFEDSFKKWVEDSKK